MEGELCHQHTQYARVACGACAALATPAVVIDVGAGVHVFRPSLPACSRCRRVRYCDAACQRADFPRHKKLCAALAACNAAESGASLSAPRVAPEEHALRLVVASARRLATAVPELDVPAAAKYAARFCRACFRTVGALPAGDGGLHCGRCKLAMCCSEACWRQYAPAHASNGACDALLCIVEQDAFQRRCVVEDGQPQVVTIVPETAVARYADLPQPAAAAAAGATPPFTDSFRRDVGVPAGLPFGRAWGVYFAAREPQRCRRYRDFPPGLLLHSTGALSRPLTALLALRAAHGATWLATATALTLHLVGATQEFEVQQLQAYEELLHLIPSLRRLDLVFIGPEVGFPERELRDVTQRIAFDSLGCCPGCEARGAQRRMGVRVATYERVLAGCAANPPPDLVVAFQAGFSELADGWRDAMTRVLSSGWPLLVTSYAEDEARIDLAAVERFAELAAPPAAPACGPASGDVAPPVQVLLPPQANPYASLVLQDDWGKMDSRGCLTQLSVDTFIARNSWYFVVRGGGVRA
jgi:splicing suppressor protein 51